MTRSELREQVFLNTNRRDKTDVVNNALDLGLREIIRRINWKSQRVTVELPVEVGVSQVNLPDNCNDVITVRVYETPDDTTDESQTSASNIEILTKRQILDYAPGLASDTSGKPAVAYIEANTLYFMPAASSPYTIEVTYHAIVDSFEDDDTETPVPAFENALIAWATSRTFMSVQLYTDSQAWMMEYERAFRHAQEADSKRGAQLTQLRGAQQVPSGGEPVPPDPYNMNIWTRT